MTEPTYSKTVMVDEGGGHYHLGQDNADYDIHGECLKCERNMTQYESVFNCLTNENAQLNAELAEARAERDEARKERDEARKERDEARENWPIWPDGEPVSQMTFDILREQHQHEEARADRLEAENASLRRVEQFHEKTYDEVRDEAEAARLENLTLREQLDAAKRGCPDCQGLRSKILRLDGELTAALSKLDRTGVNELLRRMQECRSGEEK